MIQRKEEKRKKEAILPFVSTFWSEIQIKTTKEGEKIKDLSNTNLSKAQPSALFADPHQLKHTKQNSTDTGETIG